jgi:hypothetical protein
VVDRPAHLPTLGLGLLQHRFEGLGLDLSIFAQQPAEAGDPDADPLPAVSAPHQILLYSSLPAGSSAGRWHKWEESHELITS